MSTNYYLACGTCKEEIILIGTYSNSEFLTNFTLEEFLVVYRTEKHYRIMSEFKEFYFLPEFIVLVGQDWKKQEEEIC